MRKEESQEREGRGTAKKRNGTIEVKGYRIQNECNKRSDEDDEDDDAICPLCGIVSTAR